jgi:hypothetical protein
MLRRLMILAFVLTQGTAFAQKPTIVFTPQENAIAGRIKTLRQVPDDKRGGVTKELAGLIHNLSAAGNKLMLAHSLANLSTEGDFGHDALQAVGTTLADALSEQAAASKDGMPEQPYIALAQLIRYEHVQLAPGNPALHAAC